MTRTTALSWSSGKDAAWTLHVLRGDPAVEVRVLLTTFNESFGRVAMHGTRRALARAQARAVGLPLLEVPLPWPCPNEVYEARMREACAALAGEHGVTDVAFGDLFLEDVRAYRVAQLDGTGLAPVFPIWGADTAALAAQMIDAGVRAHLTCVDPRVLPRSFAGRPFDRALLDDLPAGADPCGERGEFHTVATDGPAFAHALRVTRGESVERDGFVFTDFTLDDDGASACAS